MGVVLWVINPQHREARAGEGGEKGGGRREEGEEGGERGAERGEC